MSIFSSTKTSWSSTTLPLLDGNPEDLMRDSVMVSILEDRPITDDLITNSLNSFGSRALYFYNYGKNQMEDGLPTSNIVSIHPSMVVTLDILTNHILPKTGEVKQLVEGVSTTVGDPVPNDFAYDYLSRNNCEMDYDTYQLTTAPPNFPYDTSNKDIYFSFADLDTTGEVRIFYVVTDIGILPRLGDSNLDNSNGIVVERSEVSPTYYEEVDSPYTVESYQFVTTRYYLKNGKGDITSEIQYWIYPLDKKQFIELNNAIDVEAGSTYFPSIPLVRDGVEVWGDDYKNSADPIIAEKWKDFRNLSKYLQFDYREMGESLKGDDDDPNENYDEIDFAYINLSIPIQTENQDSIHYLYNYFNYLESKTTTSKAEFLNAINSGKEPNYSEVVIQDVNDYKVKLAWHYIERNLITGSIGEVGEFVKETDGGERVPFGKGSLSWESSAVTIKHQVSESQYIELIISGLEHTVYIYKHAYTTSIAKSLEFNDDGILNDDFNIPLEFGSFASLNPVARNKVMYDAMRMSINSKIRTKLKWYQSDAFKVIVQIVVIIITIYSGGSGATLAELLSEIALNYAITYSIQLAVRIMVDVFGLNGVLATALVIAAVIYSGYGTESLVKADTLLEQVSWVASNTSTALNKAIELEFESIKDEQEELREKNIELEQFREDNDLNNTHTDFYRVFGKVPPVPVPESAEEFMYRTTRTNPAILSLSMAENYVDSMLTLPDLQSYNALKI